MQLTWVDTDTPLPPPDQALPGGLVAAGLDLSPQRLNEAYRKGLFPWFNPGDPVLWWSPDPRMVLPCDQLRVSHSLAKRLRQYQNQAHQPQPRLRVSLNTAFDHVIQACAQREATWITPDILAVYQAWHRQGRVHSIETWVDGRLMGGLYGVSIGRCFFGESMFSRAADTSKVALAHLVAYLRRHNVPWIDCQQETPHLASLGAAPIAREEFLHRLHSLQDHPGPPWGRGQLLLNGDLRPIE